MYQTLQATVRKGQITLLEDVDLPENVTLLVTVVENPWHLMTAGENILAGLEDAANGRAVTIESIDDLQEHLTAILTSPDASDA